MKKVIYFFLVSLLVFTSCKKDASNPLNADTVPSPPILSTPKDTSSNIAVPVVLTWNASSGAKSYTLQVSSNSSFSNFIFNKSDITTTSPQIPDLNYLAVYYWRVSSSNSEGTSDWSKVWSFTTTGDEPAFLPQLSLPTNGAVEQKLSPVLVWNKVSNANSYTLQISTNSSFTNFVFNADTLTATSKQITELSGLTQYYWRVSATNNFGTKGWSETWSFTTGAAPVSPILLSPTDGATEISLSPVLTWNASTGATSYTLQVSTNSTFSSFVFNQSNSSAYKQITGLTDSTKYYWRVSATNNYGTKGWSETWTFTTGIAPIPPTLLSPSNGSVNQLQSLTIIWNLSTGATSYYLQVATDNSFTNMVYNNNVGNITSKQISGLNGLTKYYWSVTAVNNFGTSNLSVVWNFTTTNNSSCPNTPTVTYEGKIYNTILIGSQCWLKENLNIGMMINSSTPVDSMRNNGTIEKYCFDNNIANCNTYGGLYQWNEAMAYSITPGTRGICPTGWHIPTQAEFQKLIETVNNDGNSLKTVGQGTGSGIGTNTSGFSALLAGYRDGNGDFVGYLELNTFFWSSKEHNSVYGATTAYKLRPRGNDSSIDLSYEDKRNGFNVRCLKD
ncbi:MAG: FISUMP domain-containing protein [Ignavibacteriaceae bacterium]|jgi:uncharacterized protein (TIGR02145 family)